MIGASKKLLQATAGNAGGAPLDITDVFSTYLYEGTGVNNFIYNDIDLAGEGGMVWGKSRSNTYKHCIFDTERGIGNCLSPNSNAASVFETGVTKFFNNGFKLEPWAGLNLSGGEYASWTFRKAPKFFDVVTWSGNSASDRAIPHNLGCVPGMIIVKRTNTSEDWGVWHRSVHSNTSKVVYLNATGSLVTSTHIFGATNPTDSNFYVGDHPVSNNNGDSYVAYVFAHNDGDGEFGPDSDQDIIKCGSYTGNGNYLDGKYVDVGFEPQWILQKATSTTGPWLLLDTMRGWDVNTGNKPRLLADATNTEANSNSSFALTGNSGFTIYDTNNKINGNGQNYIYMAIRRGPLAPPESATDVFALGDQTATSGFPVDSVLSTYFETYTNSNHMLYDRLRAIDGSRLLFTHSNAAENTSNPFSLSIASNTGIERNWGSGWNHKMFRRAPGFFDVVAYTGAGSNQTLKHNLTVKPELSIVKYRTGSYSISTYTSWGTNTLTDGTNNPTLFLDTDRDNIGNTNAYWQEATNTEIYVGGANNENSFTYIMYLFATLAGISKVGKYTGNGSSQTINCGFTSGARYVLIKRYDSAGDWYVWDTLRGIVAGNDPYMRLNTTAAQVTSNDSIDPASSGFIVNQVGATDINVSGAKYAYYSVA